MVTYDEIKDCTLLAELWKKKGTKSGIHSSWDKFLDSDVIDLLKNIDKEIKCNDYTQDKKIGHNDYTQDKKIGHNDYTPDTDKVLRFLTTDLGSMKICILGQDPYPQEGVATGRAFEVGDAADWESGTLKKHQGASLKNILKLIYKEYAENYVPDFNPVNEPGIDEIRAQIRDNTFPILPPGDLFDSLEAQGVLFLNTSLTCKIGASNSHEENWRDFSEKLMKYICDQKPDLIWFLWGKKAQDKYENRYINTTNAIYIGSHPTRLKSFLKSDCISETKEIIDWMGMRKIKI